MFKLWNTFKKEWVKDNWAILPNGNVYDLVNKTTLSEDKFILCRATGVLDLNERMIYENDIVVDNQSIARLVKYDNSDALFCACPITESSKSRLLSDCKYEIIGNLLEMLDTKF